MLFVERVIFGLCSVEIKLSCILLVKMMFLNQDIRLDQLDR